MTVFRTDEGKLKNDSLPFFNIPGRTIMTEVGALDDRILGGAAGCGVYRQHRRRGT